MVHGEQSGPEHQKNRGNKMYIHHCISTRRWWRVSSFKFLGTHISEELTWTINITALVKKAKKWLYFLRMLRKVNLSQQLLLSFYRCSIESVLTHGMLAWYGSSSAADKKALTRVIKTAQNITKQQLPALDDIFASHCLQKVHNILRTHITLHITYLNCFHLGNCKGLSKHIPQDS